jgi:hypothetical protein
LSLIKTSLSKADEYGREDFMRGFREYISKYKIPDLFKTCTVEHVKSESNVLVQLADFLAGTIRLVYEGGVSQSVRDAFIALAHKTKLSVEEWPPRYFRQVDNRGEHSAHDKIVFDVAMNSATNFISENENYSDDGLRMQLIVLKYLLFQARFDRADYVSSAELREHLAANGYGDIAEHQFKSLIISRLRDGGVILSSSSRGYKIPQSYNDYMDFVELVDGQCIPLLERLKRAKNALFRTSLGSITTFDDPRFGRLKRVIDALDE